jgi:AcrR family transcriptional regulator
MTAMNRTDRRKLEVRDRLLQAAFDLFLAQGVDATTIEQICARADVANRTFFNHFATRQEMIRALAEKRLLNLHDVLFARSSQPIPERIVGVFGDVATTLLETGDTYRSMIGAMLVTTGAGTERGFGLHHTFVELIKDGVARGEVTSAHDPQTLADIVVGALVVSIVNWTIDGAYCLDTGLHDAAAAVADLLAGERPKTS